ncbi:ABC transporter permease [Cellulomonas biazotea]|uniref:Transport permease protein n=1 Tax=Cellulomonas biazotea TaxID=1709 RepID=A0A402DUD7_9CELL|nr:ABC transporter permease [Cellulomonas biazotea]GCE77708.1 transport permease protein [Cellulomonas biazotea]
MIADLTNVRTRELLANLTLREVKGRYKRTALGNLWSLINPIATMLIYTVVFGYFMRVEIEPSRTGLHVFALWLMCALVPWSFFAASLQTGLGSIVANSNLVKKVFFPREVLVASSVFALDVTTAIELGVLMVALMLFGQMVLPWLPMVLVLLALLTAMALGFALMLAVANVYFRDTEHFVAILLQIWMYATPIIYPFSYVVRAQESLNAWLAQWDLSFPLTTLWELNPMLHFTQAFRSVLYEETMPSTVDMLWCGGSAVVVLVVGWFVFKKFEPRMAEEL